MICGPLVHVRTASIVFKTICFKVHLFELEPVKAERSEGELIWKLADCGKRGSAHHLHRRRPDKRPQIKLCRLRMSREVKDAENRLILVAAGEREYFSVIRLDKIQRTASKH